MDARVRGAAAQCGQGSRGHGHRHFGHRCGTAGAGHVAPERGAAGCAGALLLGSALLHQCGLERAAPAGRRRVHPRHAGVQHELAGRLHPPGGPRPGARGDRAGHPHEDRLCDRAPGEPGRWQRGLGVLARRAAVRCRRRHHRLAGSGLRHHRAQAGPGRAGALECHAGGTGGRAHGRPQRAVAAVIRHHDALHVRGHHHCGQPGLDRGIGLA